MDATTSSRPLALVTGASSGIGLELAQQLAAAGFDLVVTAEDAGIHPVAEGVRAAGLAAEAIQADLATRAGVDELWTRTTALGRPLAVAALNAGVGAGGAFADNDVERELAVIDLNVRGTVLLAKHVVRHMRAERDGRILFTSSIAATQPGTFHAVYNASKSFVQSFALALREELSDSGITVTALMPGPTESAFFERAQLTDTRIGASDGKDDAAEVAREGVEALLAGEGKRVPGSLSTKVQGRTGRFVPDAAKAKAHAKLAEPGSGDG